MFHIPVFVFKKQVVCIGRICRHFTTDPAIVKALRNGELFSSCVPKYFNISRDIIDFWAAELKNSTSLALWYTEYQNEPEQKITYQQLSLISKKATGLLIDVLGMKQFHDRLLICLPKTPHYWTLLLAAYRSGIEVTVATTHLTSKDLQYRIEAFKPTCIATCASKMADVDTALEQSSKHGVAHKLVVFTKNDTPISRPDWLNFENQLETAPLSQGNETRSDDASTIFFTSGTTGSPKMVEHTQSYAIGHMLTAHYMYGLRKDDIFFCMADTGWAKLFWATIPTFITGACSFVDSNPKFNANDTLKLLRDYPITKLCAPPTAYRMMVSLKDKNLYRFHSLNDCISAGEPLNPETSDEWNNLCNMRPREGYGQSETTLICASLPGIKVKPGSMGKMAPGIHVDILDDNGNKCPVGSVGYLAVKVEPKRPVGLFSRYKNEEAKTKKAFQNGYYYTGDKASIDEEGYVWFNSRSDDVITSSGYRIGPYEVESALQEHEVVLESAVVGSPDPERYEVVKAYVVLHENQKHRNTEKLITELQEFVKQKTAPYKYPRKIEFVDSLPKTVSGKIQRHLLKKREYEMYAARNAANSTS